MEIKIINKSKYQLPAYSTTSSAGMDIRANKDDFIIKDGEWDCQMVIAKHEKAEWISVKNLLETKRGAGGFRHKGKV
jgi:dUTPase